MAERLAVGKPSVYSLVETGKSVAHRIGVGRGAIRISEDDLAGCLQLRRVEKGRILAMGMLRMGPPKATCSALLPSHRNVTRRRASTNLRLSAPGLPNRAIDVIPVEADLATLPWRQGIVEVLDQGFGRPCFRGGCGFRPEWRPRRGGRQQAGLLQIVASRATRRIG